MQYIPFLMVQNHIVFVGNNMDLKETGYISVYKPIAGWKAIQYCWNHEYGGFWEPYQTSDFAYATKEQAISNAKAWAKEIDIPFVESKE